MTSGADEAAMVRMEVVIAARPETVWEFLVDPQKLIRWMGRSADVDPRAGGALRVDVIPGSVASGHFVEVDAPRRLVFTWGWEEGAPRALPPGSTTVEIDLAAHAGGTLLRLTHRNLPTRELAQGHNQGWGHYLDRLTTVASGSDAGADRWIAKPPEFISR